MKKVITKSLPLLIPITHGIFVILLISFLTLIQDKAEASKSSKRCSEWGAQDGKDCNGDPMYDYPITRGKIVAVGNDPFNMKYKVYMSACYAPWIFASDNCLYDFPGGDSHTFDGGKAIPTYSSKDKLACNTSVNSWSSVCVYRVNVNGDKPSNFYGKAYSNVNANAFICGFAVPSGFTGIFSSGDLRPVGCVPEPLLPGPPVLNKIILGSTVPYVVQPKGDIVSWFQSLGSTFSKPAIQLMRDTDNQSLTLNYDFNLTPTGQKCAYFPGEATFYCPWVNLGQPDQVCAYKANNYLGVPIQSDPPDSLNLLGCIDRPGIEQSSEFIFTSAYRTFIAKDSSMYQGIVPLVIYGATKGQTIGKDSNGTDDIVIGTNYTLNKVGSVSVAAECNLLEVISPGSDNNKSNNGKAKACQLNNGVKVQIADYTIDQDLYNNNPSYISYITGQPYSIREYLTFKGTIQYASGYQNIAQYIRDAAAMDRYGLKLASIIPSTTSLSSLTPKYVIVEPPQPPSDPSQPPILANCTKYRLASASEQGATAYLDSTSVNKDTTNRDNQYCNCTTESRPSDSYLCPLNTNWNGQGCSCQVCSSVDPSITQLVCPGVYNGPLATGNRDYICFYSTNFNWDFITGKRNTGTGALAPSLVCNSLPTTCAATDEILKNLPNYNPGTKPDGTQITANYPIPNIGNAAWPASNSVLGVTESDKQNFANGICDNNFTYSYAYSFDNNFDVQDYAQKNGIDPEKAKESFKKAKTQFTNAKTQNNGYIKITDVTNNNELQQFKDAITCSKDQPQARCIGGVYKLTPDSAVCLNITGDQGKNQYTDCDKSQPGK